MQAPPYTIAGPKQEPKGTNSWKWNFSISAIHKIRDFSIKNKKLPKWWTKNMIWLDLKLIWKDRDCWCVLLKNSSEASARKNSSKQVGIKEWKTVIISKFLNIFLLGRIFNLLLTLY